MNIFTSESEKPEIFIKLGEKCPTKCSGCFYGTIGSQEYEYTKVRKSIEAIDRISSSDFCFFLYGVDTILNPHIEKYLQLILGMNREAILQIDDTMMQDVTYISKIIFIFNTYKNVSFLISKSIYSSEDILPYFNVIRLLEKLRIDRIRYDISIDLGKNLDILKSYSGLEIQTNEAFSNMKFQYSNSFGTLTHLVIKNPTKEILEGCQFTSCILPDFYDILNNSVHVHDMIEIDLDGNFRIHHPVCFLSDIKISHIEFPREKIISDFIVAKEYFSQHYQGNMELSCYSCIQRGYTYKSL